MREGQCVDLPLGYHANSRYGFTESGRRVKYAGIVVGKRLYSLTLITTQRRFQADSTQ